MSAPEVRIGDASAALEDAQGDVEMNFDGAADAEISGALDMLEGQNGDTGATVVAAEESKPSFIDLHGPSYLRSPIIEVAIGTGEAATVLTAHEALLRQSPFFATAIEAFSGDAASRRVEFPDQDLLAMGAFLEYLYTGEYTPRREGDALEGQAADALDDGAELLRHARVYTLAEKLGVAALKALAHSKVHRVNSSAKGEIAYARFVYQHTPKADDAIRKPIAAFWGQRSHVLRHEAEPEFRALCIEFPEFGFDVLSYVLDVRERKTKDKERDREGTVATETETPKTGRKRARNI